MARTFARQGTEIKNSDLYAANLTLSGAETTSVSLEEDLNFIRTKLKDIAGLTSWFTASPNGFNLEGVRVKKFTHWIQKFDVVAVPATQNFVALTGTAKPAENIAIAADAIGAIVAQLVGAIGAHSTDAVVGNKNLCEVRDSETNNVLMTLSGYQIYGLLQVGVAATGGNAFGDDLSDDQAQLSFVYFNDSDVLTAAPVAEIEGKDIEFAYRVRATFETLPEHAFDPTINFAESASLFDIPISVKATYYTGASIAAGDTINLSSFTNPDNMDFGAVAVDWAKNYDVYINGMLMESGPDLISGADVYYVSSTSFIANRSIKKDSMIQVIKRK